MWVGREPKEGETVKFEFANWTNLGTRIGVFIGRKPNRIVVDFGDQIRWLTTDADFEVYEND